MKDITSQTTKLKGLLDRAKKILIISHTSPDPDAISSMLLLGTTLKLNYPDKHIKMSSEELPGDLSFLDGYKTIVVEPLQQSIDDFNPDLIVMVDAMDFGRCTRDDLEVLNNWVKSNKIPVAIIDHHEPPERYPAEIYINQGSPATVQDVYEVCFDHLKLQKPENYAQTTLLGLYSDTGGFVYLNKRHRETFKIVSDLINAGASIEGLKNKLNQYSEDQLKALGELATNVDHTESYSYSFISDEFIKNWQARTKPAETIHNAVEIFVNTYIRNIEGRQWGFVVYRNTLLGDDFYSVSFRAIAGTVDVSAVANRLGGGGHKPAAGGRIQASNVQEALKKVKQTISA